MSTYVSSIRNQNPEDYTLRSTTRHSRTFSAQHRKKISAPKYAQNMKKTQDYKKQKKMEQIIPRNIRNPVQAPNSKSVTINRTQEKLGNGKGQKKTQVRPAGNAQQENAGHVRNSTDMTDEKFMRLFNTTPHNVIEFEGGTKNITGYGDKQVKQDNISAIKSKLSADAEQSTQNIDQYLRTFDTLHQNKKHSLDQQTSDLRSNLQQSLRNSQRQTKEQDGVPNLSHSNLIAVPPNTIVRHQSHDTIQIKRDTENEKRSQNNGSGHLGSGRRLSFYQRFMGRNSNVGSPDDQDTYSPDFELNIMQKNEPTSDKSIRNIPLTDRKTGKKQTIKRIFEVSKVPQSEYTQNLPNNAYLGSPNKANEAMNRQDNLNNLKLNAGEYNNEKFQRAFSEKKQSPKVEIKKFLSLPKSSNRSVTLNRSPRQGILCFRPGPTEESNFTISSQLKEISMKQIPQITETVHKKAQETQTDIRYDQSPLKQDVPSHIQSLRRSLEAQFLDPTKRSEHHTTQSLNIDHSQSLSRNTHRKSQSEIPSATKQPLKGDTIKRDTLRGSIKNDPIKLQMAEMSLDREPDQQSLNVLQDHGFTLQTSSAILSPTLKDHKSLLNSYLKSRYSLTQEQSSTLSLLDDQGQNNRLITYFQEKKDEQIAEERKQKQLEEEAKKPKAKPETTARYHFSTFSKTFSKQLPKTDQDKENIFDEARISLSDITASQSEHDHVYYQAKLQEAYDEEENMLKQNIKVEHYPTSSINTNQDFLVDDLVKQKLEEVQAQKAGTRTFDNFGVTQDQILGLDDQDLDQIEVQLESIIDTYKIDLSSIQE